MDGEPLAAVRAAKAALRGRLRVARRARPADPLAGRALAEIARGLLPATGPVAAYASSAGEPPTAELLAALAHAGRTVLLPVLRADDDLDWAEHRGTWTTGRRGLHEPDGPRLGLDAVGACGLVLVPALAAGRDGTRLGQGGGSYDRALTRVPAGVPVVAVAWPDELLVSVPVEPHDRRVDAVLTPTAVVRTGPDSRT